MIPLPSKVKHPEPEDTEVVRGCDVQVNCSATPYVEVWGWVRSAVPRAAPWVVTAKLWWPSLHKPSQGPGSRNHCCGSNLFPTAFWGISVLL